MSPRADASDRLDSEGGRSLRRGDHQARLQLGRERSCASRRVWCDSDLSERAPGAFGGIVLRFLHPTKTVRAHQSRYCRKTLNGGAELESGFASREASPSPCLSAARSRSRTECPPAVFPWIPKNLPRVSAGEAATTRGQLAPLSGPGVLHRVSPS